MTLLDTPTEQPAPPAPAPVERIRIRHWQPVDVAETIGAVVGSFCLTWLVFEQLTPLSGGLGFFVCWYAVFLTTYWLIARQRMGKFAARDRLVSAAVTGIGLILIASLLLILGYVVFRGYHAFRLTWFIHDRYGVGPLAPPTAGGGLAGIVGSAEQVGLATLISVPLGVATAIFLSEVRGPLSRPVRILTDAMSGIPSILCGLLIYALLIPHTIGESGFAVALALSISMLPTVTRASEVVLRLVPGGLREASLALGGTEWRMVRKILLPTARAGLATGVILGMARVIGETAPGLIDAGTSSKVNWNPFHGPQENLPLLTFNDIISSVNNDHIRAWTSALMLIILILILFFVARAMGGRGPGHIGRLKRFRLQRKGML
jgi:phosphate transport system permease protein